MSANPRSHHKYNNTLTASCNSQIYVHYVSLWRHFVALCFLYCVYWNCSVIILEKGTINLLLLFFGMASIKSVRDQGSKVPYFSLSSLMGWLRHYGFSMAGFPLRRTHVVMKVPFPTHFRAFLIPSLTLPWCFSIKEWLPLSCLKSVESVQESL